jgi:hypothetical protein
LRLRNWSVQLILMELNNVQTLLAGLDRIPAVCALGG